MSFELQHFVYSMYPKQGYGITAASPRINRQEWKVFCAPPPVQLQDLERIGRVWALQKVSTEVIISLFTPGARDEFGRPGIYSHSILMPIQDYLKVGTSPIAFIKYFITDPNTVGELSPLTLNAEDLQIKPDFNLLTNTKPNTLEKILEQIIRGSVVTLVCSRKDTTQMTAWVSALCQLLPLSDRIVPFITAPLSRAFRREHGLERYRLKLVQENSSSLSGTEESIDIDQDYQAHIMIDQQSKSAHYLVNEFSHHGHEGVRTLHEMWEKGKDSKALSAAEQFVTAYEVNREVVSLESVREMLKKGKKEKEEAKRYAIVMLDEHKWKNTGELVEIFTIIVESGTQQSIGEDIRRLIKSTQNIGPSERLDVCERIISSLPRIGNELFPKLKEHYGDAFLLNIKDLSNYPQISSRMLNIANYTSFESVSRQLLEGSVSDSGLFERNLRYITDIVRKQFGEQTLDFIQHILAIFPGYKTVIIQQLLKEDLLPPSVKSHLSKDVRQHLLVQAEKVIQVLKSALTP